MEIRYALVKELPGMEYDDAVARATESLTDEGFGVLTEIDVKATLKKKLDVDFKRYIILGACNPQLAHQAMSGEPFIGVLLPCNVVVMEREGGGSIVAALRTHRRLLAGRQPRCRADRRAGGGEDATDARQARLDVGRVDARPEASTAWREFGHSLCDVGVELLAVRRETEKLLDVPTVLGPPA